MALTNTTPIMFCIARSFICLLWTVSSRKVNQPANAAASFADRIRWTHRFSLLRWLRAVSTESAQVTKALDSSRDIIRDSACVSFRFRSISASCEDNQPSNAAASFIERIRCKQLASLPRRLRATSNAPSQPVNALDS